MADQQAPSCPAGRPICDLDHTGDVDEFTRPHHADDDGSPCRADASCFPDDKWVCALGRAEKAESWIRETRNRVAAIAREAGIREEAE